MQKNMGNLDRGVRVAVAIAAAVLYFAGILTGTIGIVALVVAAVFLLTSAVGFCPLYRLVGVSTCPTSSSGQA